MGEIEMSCKSRIIEILGDESMSAPEIAEKLFEHEPTRHDMTMIRKTLSMMLRKGILVHDGYSTKNIRPIRMWRVRR